MSTARWNLKEGVGKSPGAFARLKMTETDITNTNQQTEGLLELILARDNLNRAYKQVKRNKGAGGIDGMQIDELLPYLRENREKLSNPFGTENTEIKTVSVDSRNP